MLSLKDLRNLDRDDVLDALGLQRRGSTDWLLPALTALGVGLLVGAGLGLLLAPKAGNELRDDLRERLQGGLDALPGRTGTPKASRTPSAP
ncbi:MAG TPA: YtxH domain-containing protein [Myxococcaceae bacterium]|jgi:hypothetical protein|nr:YtxH domain-containing protein [Myxococcaceae bacterium]